ncbi:MAG: hypothetical protein ACJ8FY_24995 [Gemmataceae bacterium]
MSQLRPFILCLGALALANFGARNASGKEPNSWPAAVELALDQAGTNRAELEKVFRHYQNAGDKEKLEAAYFLIRNMPGHAYVVTGLFDTNKKEVPFDALKHPDLGAAQRALNELEKKHGPLHFGPQNTAKDLETVSADYLIENIDLAFKAWKTKPWAKGMTFDTFCEYILPYRANKEPVERWRAACEVDAKAIVAEMKDPRDPKEAAALVQKHSKHHVGFSDLYYLHPTDQGFKELCRKPVGRCGDMSNMQVYVYRANCIAVAGDYTPFWANRDNNHGWEVVLDKDGNGNAGLFNKAAKVYRKMFSHNLDNLFSQVNKDEKMPPWLSLRSYKDVTDQYMETTDVTTQLDYAPATPARFAYICVFNGGEWRPIQWALVKEGKATFTKMGRGIAYLVGYFQDDKVIPAAPPFILDDKGKVVLLVADSKKAAQAKLTETRPTIKDDDLKKELAGKEVEKGKKYTLSVWDRGWKTLANQTAGQQDPARFEKLPAGGLYWITTAEDRETARIFTIENGKQRFW